VKLSEFLSDVGAPVPYYPRLCPIVGGVKACIFLCSIFWKAYQDQNGWVKLSVEELTEHTGLSWDEQRLARKKLRSLGLLEERHDRMQHLMFYRIDRDALDQLYDFKTPDSRVKALPGGTCVNPDSRTGVSPGGTCVNPDSKTIRDQYHDKYNGSSPELAVPAKPMPAQPSPDFPIRPSPRELHEQKLRSMLLAVTEQPECVTAWDTWIAHRRAKKAPITEHAAEMQLKLIGSLGAHEWIQTLERSIMNGWTGLFPNSKPSEQARNEIIPRWRMIQIIEEEIETHPANPEFIRFDRDKATQELRDNLKAKRAKLAELKAAEARAANV
jgi:hypothetical protein